MQINIQLFALWSGSLASFLVLSQEVTSAAKTHEGNDLPAKTDGRAASNGGLDNPAMDLQDEAA